MPAVTFVIPGDGGPSLAGSIPLGYDVTVQSVVATIDAAGAAGPVQAELEVADPSGEVIADKAQPATIPAAVTARATWAWGLDDAAAGEVGAWCELYRDTSQGDAAYVVAGGGVTQIIPWRHFRTSDESVFATTTAPGNPPNNAPDDQWLLCRKTGAYVFENGATWVANFNFEAFVGISVQTYRGPNWDHPANLFNNTTGAPLFAAKAYFDARVSAFAAGEVPANVGVQVAQQSGANQSLKQSWLRVVYFPTLDDLIAVYG